MEPHDTAIPKNGTASNGNSHHGGFRNAVRFDAMVLLFADMAACIRFFSRLPLPSLNRLDDPAAEPDFTRISRAAPLAGMFIAIPAAAVGTLLGFTALPEMAVALLVIATLTMITGALHEDGLADTVDGFFGGAARERRLEIMKDSRIGAFGALALIVSIGLRLVLLGALWQRLGAADAALVFLGAEALSRALMVWQWAERRLARPDGIGARFGKPDRAATFQALLLALVLIVPAGFNLPFAALLAGIAFAGAASFAIGHLATRKIGGTTGDVLGAIQQISAIGFLLGVLMTG